MNHIPVTLIDALRQFPTTPRVVRHDVVFQLRVVAFKGEPVTDESRYGKALADTDEKVYRALADGVTNWRFRDHDGIEGERLNFYQPEYGYDEELPDADSVTLYDIGLYATRELPLRREDATDELPISIEQLVEEVTPILIREYGAAGVTLELHKVTFRQQLESSVSGYYDVG